MLLDDIIAVFAPARGLKRKQARLALGYLDELGGTRSYDGAKRGRLQQGWVTSGTSANAEVRAGASLLRDRARDLVRNNPYAAKAVEVYEHNLIGTGITPSPKAGDEARAAKTARAWEEWSAG